MGRGETPGLFGIYVIFFFLFFFGLEGLKVKMFLVRIGNIHLRRKGGERGWGATKCKRKKKKGKKKRGKRSKIK